MGHDHIRFVLMVAFFFSFSACLTASFGSEMGITRFSGTYTLTHPERVVQVTESITRSEKVTKVASLQSEVEKRGSRRRKRRMQTAKEFQMRRQRHKRSDLEKQTFTLLISPTMTQGTTTDQQDFCWSLAQPKRTGQCWKGTGGSSNEFTATYSNFKCSTFTNPVCQKVSFFALLNLPDSTHPRHKAERKASLPLQHEKNPLPDDHPSNPIFFVYPPPTRRPLSSEKEIGAAEGNDDYDGMDDYEPTFHLEFTGIGIGSRSTSRFPKYYPRISGGFDSYGENVPFYFDRINSDSSGSIIGHSNTFIVNENGGSIKSSMKSNVANASSFDELCRALLIDDG